MYAVTVAVNQVAGLNDESADLDGLPEFGDVSILVRHGDTSREQMKTRGLHSRQVAHRTVGDIPHAMQCQADDSMQFADQGPASGSFIDVLHHHDPRLR